LSPRRTCASRVRSGQERKWHVNCGTSTGHEGASERTRERNVGDGPPLLLRRLPCSARHESLLALQNTVCKYNGCGSLDLAILWRCTFLVLPFVALSHVKRYGFSEDTYSEFLIRKKRHVANQSTWPGEVFLFLHSHGNHVRQLLLSTEVLEFPEAAKILDGRTNLT
jgi:hypothetical protein